MSADDWFRNAAWDEVRAAAFEAKLRRAKRKEQYLRIQASMLTRTNPAVAHALLDRYFEMSDDYDHAQAHVDRANAYAAEGRAEEAVASYERALARESVFPRLLTQAYVDLPYFVATRGMGKHFARATDVLSAHQRRLMFPVDHFKWNAAHALIFSALGRTEAAVTYSRAALAAASQGTSGFRQHPRIGLVADGFIEVETQMRSLCDA